MRLEYMDPAQLGEAKAKNTPLLIPIGVMEYHSAHLPLGTDALVAYGLAQRLEERMEVIVAPPVWYGPASYAVRGPEGNSIDMDGMVFNNTMYHIFLSLLRSGFRNIYTVIAHQTETFNPTETACLDASRRALFCYLGEQRGQGWWGNPECKTFYETMTDAQNPWNWIKVRRFHLDDIKYPGDHAGKYETSVLWSFYPEQVRADRLGRAAQADWFTETSGGASRELGDEMTEYYLRLWIEELERSR